MIRSLAIGSVAIAGAIGIVMVLQSGTGEHTSNVRADRLASIATTPPHPQPFGPGVASAQKSQPVAAQSVAARTRATGVLEPASSSVGSSLAQPQTGDAANARLVDAETLAAQSDREGSRVERSTTQASLSAQETHDFFFAQGSCVVLGRNRSSKERCERAAVVAQQIVTVPKSSDDSWSHGMEYELDRRLVELVESLDQPPALERKVVSCNPAGCLIFVEGSGEWPQRLVSLAASMRSNHEIAELNDDGRWPGRGLWAHMVGDRSMIVMPR